MVGFDTGATPGGKGGGGDTPQAAAAVLIGSGLDPLHGAELSPQAGPCHTCLRGLPHTRAAQGLSG